jgi:hypothetical protein
MRPPRWVRSPAQGCGRRALPMAVAVSLAALDLAGCRTTASTPVDCAGYQLAAADSAGKTYPLLLVLLDVTDNSPDTAGRVAAKLRPYFDVALREGGHVKVVASGGDDAGVTYPRCFSGEDVFKVKRHNPTREKKDLARAGDALEQEISHLVQQQRVSRTGSVTGLLASTNHEIDAVRAVPGVSLGPVTVLVWSDLLGKSQDSDCMNVDGKKASPAIAEAIVRRCFSTSQLTSLGTDKVRFLGVDDHAATRPQQDLSRYLEGELCRRISSDCV